MGSSSAAPATRDGNAEGGDERVGGSVWAFRLVGNEAECINGEQGRIVNNLPLEALAPEDGMDNGGIFRALKALYGDTEDE